MKVTIKDCDGKPLIKGVWVDSIEDLVKGLLSRRWKIHATDGDRIVGRPNGWVEPADQPNPASVDVVEE